MENTENIQYENVARDPRQAGAVSVYGQGDALDDFPVLKAFQQYIDSEQVKAHKRLMMVCTFFSILVIVVVAVFLAIIANLRTGDHSAEATIKTLSENNSNLQKQLLDQSVRMNDQIIAQIANGKRAESNAANAELQRQNAELQAKVAAMELAEQRMKEDAARREREAEERRAREAAEARRRAAETAIDVEDVSEKVKKLRLAENLLREKVAKLKERETRIAEDEKRLHDKEVRLQQEKLYGSRPQTAAEPAVDPTEAELDALSNAPDPQPQAEPAPAKPARSSRQQSDGSLRYFDDDDQASSSAAPAKSGSVAAASASSRQQGGKKAAAQPAASSNLQIGDWTIPLD